MELYNPYLAYIPTSFQLLMVFINKMGAFLLKHLFFLYYPLYLH